MWKNDRNEGFYLCCKIAGKRIWKFSTLLFADKFLSHMKEKINQVIESVTTKTLEKGRNNKNSGINQTVSVDGEHIEQDNI